MRAVFSNAGPLIALGKLNRLALLTHLFPSLKIPRAVYQEVVVEGAVRGTPDSLTVRLFLERHEVPIVEVPKAVVDAYEPPVLLDRGEMELLSWAHTLTDVMVLMDDEVARAEARRLGIPVRGTLGILVQSYRAELLSLEETELLLLEIAARPDIWISEKLCRQVLDEIR